MLKAPTMYGSRKITRIPTGTIQRGKVKRGSNMVAMADSEAIEMTPSSQIFPHHHLLIVFPDL
jgi:hypothetical protein